MKLCQKFLSCGKKIGKGVKGKAKKKVKKNPTCQNFDFCACQSKNREVNGSWQTAKITSDFEFFSFNL